MHCGATFNRKAKSGRPVGSRVVQEKVIRVLRTIRIRHYPHTTLFPNRVRGSGRVIREAVARALAPH